MRPRKTPAVQIIFTPEINQLFDLYEKSRPGNVDQSYIEVEDQIPENSEPGLLRQVEEGVIAAEFGAVGGQKGVAVVGAYKAAKYLGNRVWQYFKNGESIEFYNLNYLSPITFPQNKNLSRDNKLSKNRLATLQALYNYCHLYQELKSTRPGLQIFGYPIFGEHRQENKIDDCKYMLNIFIGRKLKAAAEAKTEEEYESQLKHLEDFLDKVVEEKKFLQSNSNDISYVSIRNIINRVRKNLYATDSDAINTDRISLLHILTEEISTIEEKTKTLIGDIQTRLTRLSCDLLPQDFYHYSDKNTLTQRLIGLQKIEKTPYLQILFKVIYQNENISKDDEAEIKAGLESFLGTSANLETIERCFHKLIQAKNKLALLLNALNILMQIQKEHGIVALIRISDTIHDLLKHLAETQKQLVLHQKAFVDALSIAYSNSEKTDFKDNFTAHGYKRLTCDLQPIHNASLVANQISMDKDNVNQACNKSLDNKISELHGILKNLECTIAPLPTKTNETGVQSWLKAELKKDLSLDEKLPEEVTTQPWYGRLFKNAAEERNQVLQTEVSLLNTQINNLNKEKQDLIAENKAKETELSNYKTENDRFKAKQQDHQDCSKLLNKYKEIFHQFINSYIQHNNDSIGFFHFHGKTGREAANQIKLKFETMIARLNSYDSPIVEINDTTQIMKDEFKILLNDNVSILAGNYHPHSLKTYLLAYFDFIKAKVNLNVKSDFVKTYHEDKYVSKKNVDIEAKYAAMTGNTDILDLKKNQNLQELYYFHIYK